MRIIGVIDLKDGQAVHARGGRRDLYSPLHQSAGTVVGGNPLTLARHYVEAFGLSEIYLADLDAIASGTLQVETIRDIHALGPSLWIDAGIADVDDARAVGATGARTLVAGLETMVSFDDLAEICARTASPVTFSLDLRGGTPMNAALASHSLEEITRRATKAGVHAVIVLDVARVGVAAGPGLDLLRRVRSVVPDVEIFAGGGVRNLDDLRQVAQIGCAGALVATAFHEGRLTAADVEAARRFQ